MKKLLVPIMVVILGLCSSAFAAAQFEVRAVSVRLAYSELEGELATPGIKDFCTVTSTIRNKGDAAGPFYLLLSLPAEASARINFGPAWERLGNSTVIGTLRRGQTGTFRCTTAMIHDPAKTYNFVVSVGAILENTTELQDQKMVSVSDRELHLVRPALRVSP